MPSCASVAGRQESPAGAPPRPAPSSGAWESGLMHAGGAFAASNADNDLSVVDVDTIQLKADYGMLVSERVEINGGVNYLEQDFGSSDATTYGLLVGPRYYFLPAGEGLPAAVYGQARAGVLHNDVGFRDETDLAGELAAGVVWWPWEAPRGLAVDISVDYLASTDLNTLGFFIGMDFWF